MPKNDTTNQNEIRQLTIELRKQNSYTRRFLMGIITGLSTAIGATIVASIVVLILSRAVRSVEDVPILNDLLTRLEILQLLDDSENF